MRRLSIIAWVSAALLAGCGGGTNTLTGSTSTGTTTTTATVATVTVSSSLAQVAPDGSNFATITAVARDSGNTFIKGATVAFAATAGGLAVTQAVTDVNGVATANLTAAGVAVGTSIVVTASTGGKSGTATVKVASTQQTISVLTSLPQIPSDSSKSATITALVRGANNQFLQGVAVSFTATSGGITVTQGTTDVNGAAIATLSAAGDQTNRTITVTATAGASTATVPVDVTGTQLTVAGPPNLISGSTGTYTVSLTNSGNAGIANKTVTLTSSAGNTLSAASVTTGSTGQATFTLKGVNGGTDTITAAVLGLTAQQQVAVSAQSFSISPPAAGALVNLNAVQPVTASWTVSGVAQVGKTVSFATTRGTLSAPSAVTDASGNASVTITSAISGPAVISASATGVSAQANIDFIATTPAAIAVQASPTTIPTQGQSTIVAVVRDAQNNLVEGTTVNFTTINDITGGTFSVASAITDVQGRAQTVYNASSTASSSNGVTVQAAVQSTAISATTKLTVGGQTVFLSMGTGSVIGENASLTQFIVPYTVQAVDAAGHAIANVAITLVIHSVQYGKGLWIISGTHWAQSGTPIIAPVTFCPNEDSNLNGVLEPLLGEDVAGQGNNNGVLDPGDIAATTPGAVITDSTGSANFSVIYPEDHALWVQSKLTATATVQGTESSTSATFWLPMLAKYINDVTASPPGAISPYGSANSCTNPL